MSVDNLDTLETRVRKLVDLVRDLKLTNDSLEEKLNVARERLQKQEELSKGWEEERLHIKDRIEKVLGELEVLEGADQSSGGT